MNINQIVLYVGAVIVYLLIAALMIKSFCSTLKLDNITIRVIGILWPITIPLTFLLGSLAIIFGKITK